MSIATYDQLVASVTSFLHRDLASITPTFISLAEAKFNRDLRVEKMISTLTTTISAPSIALPADFLELASLKVGDDPYEFRVRTQFFILDGNYYTRVGNTLRLASDITASTTVTMDYYASIPPLQTNLTNWLLTQSPDLYLYSALLEAVPYMQLALDDPRPAIWSSGRASVLSAMSMADDDSRFSGAQLTITPAR